MCKSAESLQRWLMFTIYDRLMFTSTDEWWYFSVAASLVTGLWPAVQESDSPASPASSAETNHIIVLTYQILDQKTEKNSNCRLWTLPCR